MELPVFRRLREKAVLKAGMIGTPSFYHLHKREIELSKDNFNNSPLINKCRGFLDDAALHPAHGITHCEKVAIEAGAILSIESGLNGRGYGETRELMLCAQVAGLLHDIKRMEDDHSTRGSLEAERILTGFDMPEIHKRYITAAIRNHEAFREVISSEDETARLISDSLYDADKFRWGPENFTTTLWLIVECTGMTAQALYSNFIEKMEGIGRIKDTFRSGTGRKYGPEFIDFGLEIGKNIYSEMEKIIGA